MKKIAILFLSLFAFTACGPSSLEVHNAVVSYLDGLSGAEVAFFEAIEKVDPATKDATGVRTAFDEFAKYARWLDEYFAETEFPEDLKDHKDAYNEYYKDFVTKFVAEAQKYTEGLEKGEDVSASIDTLIDLDAEYVEIHNKFVDLVNAS